EGGPFDAVVFVRSLHHMDPLDAAVEKALELLRPGGLLLLEEFDVAAADDRTARWIDGILGMLDASGVMVRKPDHELAGVVEHWVNHQPPLHPGAAMLDEVRRRFHVDEVERGPYLYMYVCHRLVADARGAGIARAFISAETE